MIIWEWVLGPTITRDYTRYGCGIQTFNTLRLSVRRGLTDEEVRVFIRERLEDAAFGVVAAETK